MTTSEPALAREIAEAAKAKNVESVDAPVSGGDVGALRRLSIMIGPGKRPPCRRFQPLFETMGKTIVHQGAAGAGQHTKMVNQILIATNIIGVARRSFMATKAGLNLETVLQSVGSGGRVRGASITSGPRMIARNFEPGFTSRRHFLKDMGIALAEAKRMSLALPGLALAEQLYRAVEAQGLSRKGTHALMLALANLSAVTGKQRADRLDTPHPRAHRLMIRLSAFADEISRDPVEQVDVLALYKIRNIEFRAIHGVNVLDLADAHHEEFRALLRSRGVGLSAIGSPIGKIKINEPFEPHLQRFEKALALADYYEARASGSSRSTCPGRRSRHAQG